MPPPRVITDEIPRGTTEAFIALALLERPTHVWRVGSVAARLRIGTGISRKALNKFVEAGMLERIPAGPGMPNHFQVPTTGTEVLRQMARDELASAGGLPVASYVGFDVHALLGDLEASPHRVQPEVWHPNAIIILRAFVDRPGDWLTNRDAAALAGISFGSASRHVRKLNAHGLVEKRSAPKSSFGQGQLPARFRLADGAENAANTIIRGTDSPQSEGR